MNRRQFIKAGATALGAAAIAPATFPAGANESPTHAPQLRLKKAITWGNVGINGSVLEKMSALKVAGFEGVEMQSHMDQKEVLQAREETGLIIPSVCGARHWEKPLSDPDPKVRAEGLEALKQTLRDGKCYGATSVLLVPAVVTKEVTYLEAYTRSQAEIRKAIPLAEELGVKIACENVWNNFLLSPLKRPATWTRSTARRWDGTSTSATA